MIKKPEQSAIGTMELRDYFAGMVLPVIARIWHDSLTEDDEDCTFSQDEDTGRLASESLLVAADAYGIADAMMRVRSETMPSEPTIPKSETHDHQVEP